MKFSSLSGAFLKKAASALLIGSVALTALSASVFAEEKGNTALGEVLPADSSNEAPEGAVPEYADKKYASSTQYYLSLPTKKEIASKYFELGMNETFSTTYSSSYSLTSPYSAGALSDATLQQALNTTNFIRFVAGLNSVTLNDEYNDYAQHAALVNAVNGQLSHYPTQPSDMSDEMYELGAYGAKKSNIGWGYTSIPDSIIRGYMEDTDSSNISRVGHRRWILYPPMQQIGFGMVGRYTATYAHDNSFGGVLADDFIAWPPQNMPYELYTTSGMGYAFSVNLGEEYDTPDISNVTVKLTSELQNKSWTLNSSSTDMYSDYLNVENSYYGMAKCIIFNVGEFENGDKVTVEINGIYKDGVSSPIAYTVDFFSVYDEIKPDTPVVSAAKLSGLSASFSWQAAEGATEYRVYRAESLTGAKTLIGTVTGTSYTDTSLNADTQYYYFVTAYNSTVSCASDYSAAVSAKVLSSSLKPSGLKASAGDKSAVLSWNAVKGVSKYRIYYYLGGRYYTAGDTTASTFTVTGLKNGTDYGFLVRAFYNGSLLTPYTANDRVNTIPNGSPAITSAVGDDGAVSLQWNAYSGAEKYRIFYYLNGKYYAYKNTTRTSYKVSGLKNGTKYGFLVRAYVDGKWTSYKKSDNYYATPTAKPVVAAYAGNGKVTLKWDAVENAEKYRVFYYLNGKYYAVRNTTLIKTTVTGLNNGTKYGFLVRAYVNGAWTSYTTDDLTYATPIAKPVITSATAGSEKVTLKWSAVSGAEKYAVYYYYGGKYTHVRNTTLTSWTVTGLTSGKNYGFLVKAYVNGSWTSYNIYDVVSASPK